MNFKYLFVKSAENIEILQTVIVDPKSFGVIMKLVVELGFTTLLTSQIISVAFYSEREREKTEKFCSEALISI